MKRFLLCLAVLMLAACGGDSTSPTTRVSGTWHLRSINGTSLPYTFPPDNGTTATVTGSTLTLSDNGSYNEVVSLRLVSANATNNATVTEVGTWTANGGAITFNDNTDQATYQGSVSGNTLTEIVGGFTEVYSH